MTTSAIRQKLYEYIRDADEQKVKAMYKMLDADLPDFDWANDNEFLETLDQRKKAITERYL